MIETPMLTVEESARRDAFVRRLFQAIVEGGNLVTIYLGNRLGLYQALAKLGSLTPSELCTGYFCHPFRYPFARVTRWSFITFLCCCGMWYPTEEGVGNFSRALRLHF